MKEKYLSIAETLKPELLKEKISPQSRVTVSADEKSLQGWRVDTESSELFGSILETGKPVIYDFGDHYAGKLTLDLMSHGKPVDAPVKVKVTLGEMPCEVGGNLDGYQGWISATWFQEEIFHIDVIPGVFELPRRYAFRYVKFEVLCQSSNTTISLKHMICTAETSADSTQVEPLTADVPEILKQIDAVSINTLKNCMHDVFEDGPKRDRRLWLGDLRLQAIANYETFNNCDLVKRCLYLFGGLTNEEGWVSPCIFTEPVLRADDLVLYDYSLLFVSTLMDYYKASGDRETLEDLWPVAIKQLELGVARLDENNVVKDDPGLWCFIDWAMELNKQTPAHAVLIYALKSGLEMAETLDKADSARWISEWTEKTREAALTHLWDSGKKLFISGEGKNVSWHSQVWMVLAGVLPQEEAAALIQRILTTEGAVGPGTPYTFHHLIDALVTAGLKDMAKEQMIGYWGEMVNDGADCFWEVFNPFDKAFSPYGSNLLNSYCHAWSCTPSYFIRKNLI